MKRIIILFLPLVVLISCDYLDPKPIDELIGEDIWIHASYGEGLLARAYNNLDANYPFWIEYLSDNAVPNRRGDNIHALGGWTVENSPIGQWNRCYNSIKYLNIFLENSKDLKYFVDDPIRDSIARNHRIGEAYFLRAWYHWLLLRDYGGYTDNQLLGFPIVTEVLEIGDELDLPRNTYEECVEQIVADLDSAIEILPLIYQGAPEFTGARNLGRGSGLAAMALKARVYLHTASPAYGNSSQELWIRAAEAAYDAIIASGGLRNLNPYGNFNNSINPDYIWIEPAYVGNGWERRFYPPSLYGDGIMNPSQSLIDAFPASDGYPIDVSSLYNESNPYANRDPRFYRFIFFNGDYYNNTDVSTHTGGGDAPGGLSLLGTRTGYYMKKLLSSNVRLTPGDVTNDVKFHIYLGMNELYLNFAEAVNEAYGPDNKTFEYSAADVMAKIRLRANPGLTNDTYMQAQVAAGKDVFRSFIHNERRIELSFEGFRFWDIRRWNMPLNYTIRGVNITRSASGTYSYQYVDVENHIFSDHMRYPPLPYEQTLVMKNLKQNSGW